MATEFTLDITLRGIEPRIWRTVVVPATTYLERLHRVIQVAMGWTNSHLHQFTDEQATWCYSDPRFELEDADDEFDIQLQQIAPRKGARFLYEYDFGDGWTHVVTVQEVRTVDRERQPTCTHGERACPPEDVGGCHGYCTFVDAIADPSHSRHEEFAEWLPGEFDPERFDVAAVNELLADPDAMSWSAEDEFADDEWFATASDPVSLDRDLAAEVVDAMLRALAPVGERYGLSFSTEGNARLRKGTNLTVKLVGSVLDESGWPQSPEAVAFREHASHQGLRPTDLHRVVSVDGEPHRIVGLNLRASRYSILLDGVTDARRIRMEPRTVRELLEAQGEHSAPPPGRLGQLDLDPELFPGGEYDEDAAEAYIEAILGRFDASPEAAELARQGVESWAVFSFLDLGISYLSVTPPRMNRTDVEEVVFRLIPRKVSATPFEAEDAILELRAFWAFLAREFDLPNAAACSKGLQGDAIQRLERALADPSNFGMAKSIMMQGVEAGFDMTSPEGLQQFIAAQNNSLAPITPLPQKPKTGRNDPCPCGSGKKYKRCCLT